MEFTVYLSRPLLYKRGAKGEVRVWYMESGCTDPVDLNGVGAHRVVSGILGGAETRSGWSVGVPKNVGRSNETTSVQQAELECMALYEIKESRGYFRRVEDIDNVPFTKPMLAVDIEKRRGKFDIAEGVYEQPKLDGIRCVARADGLFTRTGKPITAIPHVHECLSELFRIDPDLVLDGELYNHELREDFNTISSVVRKSKPKAEDLAKARDLIQYHVYDMPSHNDVFSARDYLLAEYVEQVNSDFIRKVPVNRVTSETELDEFYAQHLENGYEGQMIRLDEPYQNKRSNFLMKRKDFISDEFPVTAVHEGVGNWMGYAKRFTFQLPDGRECGAGVRGAQAALRELLECGRVPDWATVRFFTPTPDGMPRFPVVTDWGWGARSD